MKRVALFLFLISSSTFGLTSAESEEPFVFTTPVPPSTDTLQEYCLNFLECESEMMNVHQMCTEKSRKATAKACHLEDDFKALQNFMDVRVNEFASCVSNETAELSVDLDRLELVEIPEDRCEALDVEKMHAEMKAEGCWKTVASVKKRCRKLQKCCPAAKTCMKSGRNSEATQDVRLKHIEINRKTLDCRNEMKKVLNQQHADSSLRAKAHAVLTSEDGVDVIHKKYVFNKRQRHQLSSNVQQLEKEKTLTRTTPDIRSLIPKEHEIVQKIVYRNNRIKKVRPLGRNAAVQSPQTVNIKTTDQKMGLPKHHVAGAPERVNPTKQVHKSTLLSSRSQSLSRETARIHNRVNNEVDKSMSSQLSEFESLLSSLEAESKTKSTQITQTTTQVPRTTTTSNRVTIRPRPSNVRPSFSSINMRPSFSSKKPAVLQNPSESMPSSVPSLPSSPSSPFHLLTRPATSAVHSFSRQQPRLFKGLRRPIWRNPNSRGRAHGVFQLAPTRQNALPRLQGMRQPQSFALPPTVNLTKMHILDARPALKMGLRRPPPSPEMNALGRRIVPDSFGRDGFKARAHAIKTKTNVEKPIPSQISRELTPLDREAFVNDKGAWTLEPLVPHKNIDYPDYENAVAAGNGVRQTTTAARTTKTSSTKKPWGYRNKVLAAWNRRHTVSDLVFFKKGQTGTAPTSTVDDDSTEIEQKMQRTTMTSIPLVFSEDDTESSTLTSTTPSTTSTRTPATTTRKPVVPPPAPYSSENEPEMKLAKADLIKNLETFLANHEREKQKHLFKSEEHLRMQKLRTHKQEYTSNHESMDYCQLYAICTHQQKHLQKSCESPGGRLIPGLPKRRFGECNKRLVSEYKQLDKMAKKVERKYESCVHHKINMNHVEKLETCPENWPILPEFEAMHTCSQKVRLVQNHCNKLGRCCSAVQECRNKMDVSSMSQHLVQKQEDVAKESAKCQIQAYSDYRKFRTRHFGAMRMHKRTTRVQTTTASTPRRFTIQRVFPTLIHMTPQPQSRSIQLSDSTLGSLNRLDTSHFRLFWT